jgi:ELWxxDGT repeat protein
LYTLPPITVTLFSTAQRATGKGAFPMRTRQIRGGISSNQFRSLALQSPAEPGGAGFRSRRAVALPSDGVAVGGALFDVRFRNWWGRHSCLPRADVLIRTITKKTSAAGYSVRRQTRMSVPPIQKHQPDVQRLESRFLLSVDLFSDTNPAANTGTTSNAFVFDCNGSLYFDADDGTHGIELFKSNGTPGNATLLKDINPSGSSSPASFCDVNGTFYFTATDGTHGIQLWKTDGTSDGTSMVKIINPTGTFQGQPISLFNFNGTLYFSADDGTHGRELWTSDGTDAGTQMIDIRPGGSTSSSTPGGFIVLNNKLYFSAQDGTHGIELWTTDGTPGGTAQVCDIFNGNNQFGPTVFIAYNGNLYFNATNNTDANELWRSDGIVGDPAVQVKNINPTGSSTPQNFAVFNNLLYFAADDGTHGVELWVTDGTDAGTSLVKDIDTFPKEASSPTGLFVYNGSLYFDADSGNTGQEFYKSDGTTAGTAKLKDINPTISGSGFTLQRIFNGALYFVSNDGTHGSELWRTDGTASGTVMVRDINPGSTGAAPASLRIFNNGLYFYANDGTHGNEVWKLAPQAVAGSGSNLDAPAVTITLEQPGSVLTTAATYQLQQQGTGTLYPVSSVTYDAASRTGTFNLPKTLPDGSYRLSVPSTAATDAYGNWLSSGYDVNFSILTGDLNHNNVVDTSDFTLFAQNFAKAAATYSQGDFNYDGVINALDFNALATNFGAHLPAPPVSVDSIFSSRDIDRKTITLLD